MCALIFLSTFVRVGTGWRLGFLVSTVLVVLAVPQAVSVSGGALPNPNTKDMFHILVNALPMQTMLKITQYFSLRSIKRALDGVSWMPSKELNTIISYGLTATVLQCAAYNNCIRHTYKHFDRAVITFHRYDNNRSGTIGASCLKQALNDAKVDGKDAKEVLCEYKPSGDIDLATFMMLVERCRARKEERGVPALQALVLFFDRNVRPGIIFSLCRECGATGSGIVLGPRVRVALAPWIGSWRPVTAKIVTGIMAGMFCSFVTQWLHNNALRASNIFQSTGNHQSAPDVLYQTWVEFGPRMFYLNAERRILSTATATTILGLIDIFK